MASSRLQGQTMTSNRWKLFSRALALAAFALTLSLPVPAGCMSDCRDQYTSALEDCHSEYDGPDDADDLQLCIQDAKAEYESCVDDCQS
jgi:hypothetical protein